MSRDGARVRASSGRGALGRIRRITTTELSNKRSKIQGIKPTLRLKVGQKGRCGFLKGGSARPGVRDCCNVLEGLHGLRSGVDPTGRSIMARWYTVVVYIATTGLDPSVHVPVEIAWLHQNRTDPVVFIPHHKEADIDRAEEDALRLTGYYGRLDTRSSWDNDGAKVRELHAALKAQTFASWNCCSDVTMLNPLFRKFGLDPRPWHRTVDLRSYTATCMKRSPNDLPALWELHERKYTAKEEVEAISARLKTLKAAFLDTVCLPACQRTLQHRPAGQRRRRDLALQALRR